MGKNNGLVKRGSVKHGQVKQGSVKYGLVEHGLVKHGLVKHGLTKRYARYGFYNLFFAKYIVFPLNTECKTLFMLP